MSQGRGYPPVKSCIYCGKSEGSLSREHIIARAIGGNITLAQASCQACANVTRGIEQECFAETLKPFRLKASLPMKDASGPPVRIQFDDGREETTHKMGGVTDPVFLMLPSYPLPSLITGQKVAETYELWSRTFNKDVFSAIPGAARIGGVHFNDRTFCRMLAKVGHAFAVAEYGLSRFRPLLPNFILGRERVGSNVYVGCTEPVPPNPDATHTIELLYTGTTPRYLVANIRLFSEYGTPNYMVVVGTVAETEQTTNG